MYDITAPRPLTDEESTALQEALIPHLGLHYASSRFVAEADAEILLNNTLEMVNDGKSVYDIMEEIEMDRFEFCTVDVLDNLREVLVEFLASVHECDDKSDDMLEDIECPCLFGSDDTRFCKCDGGVAQSAAAAGCKEEEVDEAEEVLERVTSRGQRKYVRGYGRAWGSSTKMSTEGDKHMEEDINFSGGDYNIGSSPEGDHEHMEDDVNFSGKFLYYARDLARMRKS